MLKDSGAFSLLWVSWIYSPACVKPLMLLFSTKPTRNNCPGATWRNWCGLVVLWDKRLLSPHSRVFYSLPIHIYRALQPPACLSFLPSFCFFFFFVHQIHHFSCVSQVIKSSTDFARESDVQTGRGGWKCVKMTARGRSSGQDESDIPIAGLGSPPCHPE